MKHRDITDYTFKQAQKLKDLLSNPEALAAANKAAAAASAPAAKATTAAPAKKAEEKKVEEKKEESDGDMGFDLFG